MSSFIDSLHSGRMLLMDGAMGTELQRAGLRRGKNAATWNVLHPERVRAIHRAYADAGAEVLLTNTFPINDGSYGQTTGLDKDAVWRAAYDLIGPKVFRLAAVGPVADGSSPSAREFNLLGLFKVRSRCHDWRPHTCRHFSHAILLETCSSPRVRYAIRRLHKWHADQPILLSLTYHRDAAGKVVTFSGHSPEWFASRAQRYGLAALGVNCGRDISVSDCAEIIRRYRRVTDLPLFARPNAGTPKKVSGRWVYPLTPRAMADRVPELLEAGVCMVGGCCGTTPKHIAALRPVVDRWNAGRGNRYP